MIDIKQSAGSLSVEVRFERYLPTLASRIARIPNSIYNKETKRWRIPLSQFMPFYRRVNEEFLVTLSPLLKKLRDHHMANEHGERVFTLPLVDVSHLHKPGIVLETWQHEGISHAVHWYDTYGTGCVLGIAPGGGKTLCGMIFQRYMGELALVLCPTTIKEQWKREIEIFIGGTAMVIDGTPKQRAKQWAEVNANPEKYEFVIMNYELMKNDYEMMPSRKLVIVDEAHRYKNPSAVRSKMAYQYKKFKGNAVFLEMTGTPIINARHDAWNLLRLAGHSFGKNLHVFQKECCWIDDYGNVCGIRLPDAREYLDRMAEICFIVTKDELAKTLPPRLRLVEYLKMGDRQSRFYKEVFDGILEVLKDDEAKEYTDIEIEAIWGRLRQAAAVPGAVKAYRKVKNKVTKKFDKVEMEVKAPDESIKLDRLDDFFQDFSEDYLIVYSGFTTVLDAIQAKFPKAPWVRIDGDVHPSKRQAIIDAARANGSAYFLISDALNEGVNMQFCHDFIFFTTPLTDANREQLEGRIFRKGQTETSRFYYWLVEDTVEEKIFKAIDAKRDLSRGLGVKGLRKILTAA